MTQDSSSERRIPPVGDPRPPEGLPFLDRQRQRDRTNFDPERVREGRKDLRIVPQSAQFIVERVSRGIMSPEDAIAALAQRDSIMQKQINRAKAQAERLTGQALYDQLTGLPNRRAYELELRRLIQEGQPFGAAYSDIDHFKGVNDTLGHDAGDLALKTAASTLTESVREEDIVIRFGGDEFILLFPGVKQEDQLQETVERARQNVAAQSIPLGKDRDFSITMSFGGGIFRGSGQKEFQVFRDRIDREGLLEGAKTTRNAVRIIR